MNGYFDKETRDDPRYVKYWARSLGKKNGEWYEEMLALHKCTNEDWKLFNPPSIISADSI